MSKELIERLRGNPFKVLGGDYIDAANTIEAITAERDRLREELAGLKRSLAAAKTVIESKDKAYSLIQQRWDAMAAKAATVDSERECNGRLTAEIDRLSAELAVLRAQEPVAWMHETRVDVIHESVRTLLKTLSEGAGPESLHRPIDKSERYTIPLYAAPVPAQPAVAVPAEVARSVQVLRAHNAWRRGNKTENWEPIPYSPAELGRAIDIVCDHATHTAKPDLLKRATDYAHDIVTWLHRDHYSENTKFEPFGDLLGLLSQIDNMICGWKEPAHVTGGIVDTLRKFNAWRKGEIHEWDVGTHSGPDPQEITKAIDDACAMLATAQKKEGGQ